MPKHNMLWPFVSIKNVVGKKSLEDNFYDTMK